MGRGQLGKRYPAINHRGEILRRKVLHHRIKCLLGPVGAAQERDVLEKDVLPIETHVGAGGGAAAHQHAALLQATHALHDGAAPDMIHHHVHARLARHMPHVFRHEAPRRVDEAVGAYAAGPCELLLIGGGHDDVQTENLRNLDAGHTDGAARCVDENGLALLDPCLIHQHFPGGDIGDGDASRLLEAHVLGNQREIALIHHDVFLAAAVGGLPKKPPVATKMVASGFALIALAAIHRRIHHYTIAGLEA